MKNLDALLVEANHDISMLEAGPYPWVTKKRIKSGVGHLSNEDCGELLASVKHSNLKLVVLMHMSETNNHPELAKITARQALGESSPEMILAQQNLSLIHISEPTRPEPISYAVFCLKKKKTR